MMRLLPESHSLITKSHDAYLDGLRGLAALTVFLTHVRSEFFVQWTDLRCEFPRTFELRPVRAHPPGSRGGHRVLCFERLPGRRPAFSLRNANPVAANDSVTL